MGHPPLAPLAERAVAASLRGLSATQPWGLAGVSPRAGCGGQGNPAWVSVPLSVPPETEVQTPGVLGALNQDFFFKQLLDIFPGVLRTQ